MKGNLMKGKMKGHFKKGKKGTVHELEFILTNTMYNMRGALGAYSLLGLNKCEKILYLIMIHFDWHVDVLPKATSWHKGNVKFSQLPRVGVHPIPFLGPSQLLSSSE